MQVIQGQYACGTALPNDMGRTDRKHDRGYAKVKNCDPAVIQKYNAKGETKVWSAMNDQAMEIYKDRLGKEQWIRNNKIVPSTKPTLGAWWTALPLCTSFTDHQREDCAASASSSSVLPLTKTENKTTTPPEQPSLSVKKLPAANSPFHVDLVVVSGSDLWWMNPTNNTPLGHTFGHA